MSLSSSNVGMLGSLVVLGPTALSNNITVTKNANVYGIASISNAAFFSSNVTIAGCASAATSSNLTNVQVGSSLVVGSNLCVNCNVCIGTTSATAYPLYVVGANATAVAIYTTGDIQALSDSRVKTNVIGITGALEKMRLIKGYTYNRSDLHPESARQAGVLAQEIEAVLPEVVHTDEASGLKSVAYGNLMSLLIAAINELDAKVSALF